MTATRLNQGGQAAAEFPLLVLVVAALAIALAAWAPRQVPGRLDLDRPVPALPAPSAGRVAPFREALRHRPPDDWSRTGLRRWFAEAPDHVRMAALGVVLASAAAEEALAEVRRLRDDPVGWVREALGAPGAGDADALLRLARGLPGWVRTVHGLGFRNGSERVAHDLGHLAGRAAIEWLTRGRTLRRALAGLLGRTAGGARSGTHP
jgi:hypothetical protein